MILVDWFLSFIQKRLLGYPTLITTPSEYAKNVLVEKYGIDPKRIVILHNGVSTHLFERVAKK